MSISASSRRVPGSWWPAVASVMASGGSGKVYLVGAGPGDPGLITVKGLRCLEEAQVVVYDRLVDPRLLHRAPRDAELVFVGKGRRKTLLEQDKISQLLVRRAQEGKRVVRLKGGDPFVFGRGGEEAQALARAGVPFEVVPGVTSAIAAPAYAGIPLTHRQLSSAFTVVSGSEDPSKEEPAVHWERLAQTGGTLVVLMGWEQLPSIVGKLLDSGMEPATPAALVEWGTEPRQRTVTGTLRDIVQRGREAGLEPPVVAVFGEVVRLREELPWFEGKPLYGKRILVTRSRTQASALSELLAEQGAEPVELPTIEIKPLKDYSELDGALEALGEYRWVVFTSANAVEVFFARLKALGLDARALSGLKVCAIGPATAESLSHYGVQADFVPREYLTEALLQGFEGAESQGARVLLPRADIGREELVRRLEELGATVHQVTAYRTVLPEGAGERAQALLEHGKIDVATFTSSSTVENLVALLEGRGELLHKVTVACIGPVTAQRAQELGLRVDVVARSFTIPGLVQALLGYFAGKV
ncbi:MAG: uroporphyrinogen-III C-methyltransferase [Dehalococcoidia bacterium]